MFNLIKKTVHFSIFFSFFLQSCLAPSNFTYESAKTIGKGNKEIKVYNAYGQTFFDELNVFSGVSDSTETRFINNFSLNSFVGGSFGYGVTDKYDVKLIGNGGLAGSEYSYSVGLVNKFNLIDNHLAVNLPISYTRWMSLGDIEEGILLASPQLIGSYSFNSGDDLTLTAKVDFPLANNRIITSPLFGTTLGYGFDTKDNLAFRIETGYITNIYSNTDMKFNSFTLGSGLLFKF